MIIPIFGDRRDNRTYVDITSQQRLFEFVYFFLQTGSSKYFICFLERSTVLDTVTMFQWSDKSEMNQKVIATTNEHRSALKTNKVHRKYN